MVTLYHVNHSCKDLVPGHVFGLLPINIAAGSEHAEACAEWKQAFPAGLSGFGFRHMTPDQPYGEVPESKREMEWECEQIRQKHFRHMQSRYQAFFAVATLEEAIAFREGMKAEAGMTGSIWEIEAERIHHCGDMRLLTRNEANLRAYWVCRPRRPARHRRAVGRNRPRQPNVDRPRQLVPSPWAPGRPSQAQRRSGGGASRTSPKVAGGWQVCGILKLARRRAKLI